MFVSVFQTAISLFLIASRGSVIGFKTLYSTSTWLTALRAFSRESATTIASTSPAYEVKPPTGISAGQSLYMIPISSSPGTSAAVNTARTPGCNTALDELIFKTSARACFVNTSAACSIPGMRMSSIYPRSPRVKACASYFATRTPSPPVETISGDWPLATVSIASSIFT